jgi:deoxyribonuclease-1
MDRFRACERQAREQGKGLWATGFAAPPASSATEQTSSSPTVVIRGNRRSKIYHLPSCPDYARLSVENTMLFASEADARRAGYRKAKNCP